MEESKILLFIVEGKSDEASLGPSFEEIIDKRVKFKVMNSDITSDYGSNPSNIELKIRNNAVKRFLTANPHFYPNDICQIIHIVDVDGAFINDEYLVDNNTLKNPMYFEDHIENNSKNKQNFIRTRKNKREILNYLSTLDTLKISENVIVPYEIYYMSCNLEHVLHDKRNSSNKQKMIGSVEFSDRFDNPKDFIDFFNNSTVKVDGDYHNTWSYIKKDFNSLKRGSNIWICLDKHKDDKL